jgi:hypothetical protein
VQRLCTGTLYRDPVQGSCTGTCTGTLYRDSVQGPCTGTLYRDFVQGSCTGTLYTDSVQGLCTGTLYRDAVQRTCTIIVCFLFLLENTKKNQWKTSKQRTTQIIRQTTTNIVYCVVNLVCVVFFFYMYVLVSFIVSFISGEGKENRRKTLAVATYCRSCLPFLAVSRCCHVLPLLLAVSCRFSLLPRIAALACRFLLFVAIRIHVLLLLFLAINCHLYPFVAVAISFRCVLACLLACLPLYSCSFSLDVRSSANTLVSSVEWCFLPRVLRPFSHCVEFSVQSTAFSLARSWSGNR